MKRWLKFLAWLFGTFLLLAVAASFHPMVRNVYRAINPSQSYNSEAPQIPELSKPAILVFSKTNGFRHDSAIEKGMEALRVIASQRGWSLFHTENGAVFEPDILPGFQVVLWHNSSGAPLSQKQRRALRDWIEQGGGFVGVHASVDGSHADWEWYAEELLGTRFIGHTMGPQFQKATLRIEQHENPATRHLDATWEHVEEWYSFDSSVRGTEGVEVLATVDEATYSPRLKILWSDTDISMGDHPALWTKLVGQGRAFFSVLGHDGASYESQEHRSVLEGAIEWVGQLNAREQPEAAQTQKEMETVQ